VAFKSDTQPLCRCCGKPIKKTTVKHYIRDTEPAHRHGESFIIDCQRRVNDKVVSVSRGGSWSTDKSIRDFTTWDGESYDNKHFCTGACATRWGYIMAEAYPDVVSKAYNAAMAEKKKCSRVP
jgi:hypothetical protein